MKKVKCSHCHGTGKVTCSTCKGRGRIKCPTCRSYGHACPVCTKGWDRKPGYVKDKYGDWVHCPNCHGDYTNSKFTCWRCGGDGVIDCDKTERCSVCGGTGKVEKFSSRNSRAFLALAMIGGLFGLHYAYIRRWGLFVIQFVLFAIFAALLFGSEMISEHISIEVAILSKAKWCAYAIVLIHWLIGLSFVKEDGQGCSLVNEFKKCLFWLFFLLFGFTGAHLAYGKSKLLVFHAGFLMLFSLPAVNWGWGDKFIDTMVSILVYGSGLAWVEVVVASIISRGRFIKEGNE
ncbi:MAG: hypothetical protein IJ173_04555 [Kiritimatiellae bacterium]|nr:hypothetical protein [Kiritimatiellia bacterium]